jgi:hypothetical protein
MRRGSWLLGLLAAAALVTACGGGQPAPERVATAPLASSAAVAEPTKPVQVAGEADAGGGARPGEPGWQPFDPHAGRTPPLRTSGDLTVESPPRRARGSFRGRLRTHVEGALGAGSPRVWVGVDVPAYVELAVGPAELFLLDPLGEEGHLAFYRAPYGAGRCTLGETANCDYAATLYDTKGKVRWTVALSDLLSVPDRLEIQDIRYAGGVLYFNEACQSYARESGGKCSSLVAYDPVGRKVLWRTVPLVSNNVFLPLGDFLIAGYGFTAEPDHVSIVRRTDGKVLHRQPIPGAHDGLTVRGDTLVVTHYYEKTVLLRMVGMDGPTPRLAPIPSPGPSERRQPTPPRLR